MGIIIIFFLGIALFMCLGVFGWFLKIIECITEFLFDGCMQSLGCLFWVFIVILFLIAMFS